MRPTQMEEELMSSSGVTVFPLVEDKDAVVVDGEEEKWRRKVGEVRGEREDIENQETKVRLGRLGQRQEVFERDTAVPAEHLLENIVFEYLRSESNAANSSFVNCGAGGRGRVHATERVRARHDRHNLRLVEAHAPHVDDAEGVRVGGERQEVRRVRSGVAKPAGEGDLRAAARFDDRNGGEVHRIGYDHRVGVGFVVNGGTQERMGHVPKSEALVTDATKFVDGTTIDQTVALEPGG
ncbi:hypothetical protein BDK51DRAFT_50414 [Blyttiomyces helicus]|uniref:Uncharacterized protein n=1 Tax=Blyttiomyces helicus TaxID=388810 RepID=A0A4P9WBG6_9FUNG|nr:hypothetical protein BDK51DRAFT_50414 [Blyttiomyces helicus]|eukprot:RKO88893.1 hypothetical protein BDK51DRAFT_50414 [Blyttiomyces helicus]